MQVRKYERYDYYTLVEWWSQHSWKAPSINMLPKTGFIVENICAGFLYKTDSEIAWLEFIISNPVSDKEERSQALDLVINSLVEEAKLSGFKAIFTSVEHKKLIERYKEHGFVESDKDMTNMVKRL